MKAPSNVPIAGAPNGVSLDEKRHMPSMLIRLRMLKDRYSELAMRNASIVERLYGPEPQALYPAPGNMSAATSYVQQLDAAIDDLSSILEALEQQVCRLEDF